MNHHVLASIPAACALVLPGCRQSETTVLLNKDGSGTRVGQTAPGVQMNEMMGQRAAMDGCGNLAIHFPGPKKPGGGCKAEAEGGAPEMDNPRMEGWMIPRYRWRRSGESGPWRRGSAAGSP